MSVGEQAQRQQELQQDILTYIDQKADDDGLLYEDEDDIFLAFTDTAITDQDDLEYTDFCPAVRHVREHGYGVDVRIGPVGNTDRIAVYGLDPEDVYATVREQLEDDGRVHKQIDDYNTFLDTAQTLRNAFQDAGLPSRDKIADAEVEELVSAYTDLLFADANTVLDRSGTYDEKRLTAQAYDESEVDGMAGDGVAFYEDGTIAVYYADERDPVQSVDVDELLAEEEVIPMTRYPVGLTMLHEAGHVTEGWLAEQQADRELTYGPNKSLIHQAFGTNREKAANEHVQYTLKHVGQEDLPHSIDLATLRDGFQQYLALTSYWLGRYATQHPIEGTADSIQRLYRERRSLLDPW